MTLTWMFYICKVLILNHLKYGKRHTWIPGPKFQFFCRTFFIPAAAKYNYVFLLNGCSLVIKSLIFCIPQGNIKAAIGRPLLCFSQGLELYHLRHCTEVHHRTCIIQDFPIKQLADHCKVQITLLKQMLTERWSCRMFHQCIILYKIWFFL